MSPGPGGKALHHYRVTGDIAMMRTIYSSLCGALIFIAALIPTAILIMDKAGF